jgi:pyruvate dehydrogenase E2 component (dihydrolipoamide acetyltransferase)
MAFEFKLPDVGEGIQEGEIVAWHVSAGDQVSEDQVIADVETDKAVVDLPAPVTGTVLELHSEEGEMVPVGDVVATIEVEGEASEDELEDVEPTEEAGGDDGGAASGSTTDATSQSGGDGVEAATGDGRVFAPPNVRRLARELGVDITGVEGSGPSGRITEGDVRAAAESDEESTEETKSALSRRDESEEAETATSASAGGAVASVETADRDQTLAAPATRKFADEHGVDLDEVPTEKAQEGEAFVEQEDVQAFLDAQEAAEAADAAEATAGADDAAATAGGGGAEQRETREPYRGIRRTIGQQMKESAYTAPHAAHHDKADVSELVQTRAELKGSAEEQGIKLTYMPFIIKAIVAALKEYPELNSELDEDAEEVILKHYYNIGIAVATDAGLMVPVLKDAENKGLLQIASGVNELAAKARDRKISPEEMQGSTFTITNFGAFGGEYANPIINYPETAILGLGSIEQRPVVEDGEVVARHTLPLSLAIDHRVIDGAEAAQFVNTVKEYLENPSLLLLE